MLNQSMRSPSARNPLRAALGRSSAAFIAVFVFSAAVNILMLTGPLFMLQVYDRVLASRSVETLFVLFAIVVVLYAFLGIFDYVRTRILSRTGARLDRELSASANKAWIQGGLPGSARHGRPLGDLLAIRQFLSSPGVPALFDLPWVPFYLVILYVIHPVIGFFAGVAAIIVVALTFGTEVLTKKKVNQALDWEVKDLRFSEAINRNAETVVGMGMEDHVTNRWSDIRARAVASLQQVDGRSGVMSALIKAFRLLVQSAILGIGAYYAIRGEITPGAMIAASILGGRALVPIDQAVGNWKNFQRARAAYHRLSGVLAQIGSAPDQVELPEPAAKLQVQSIAKLARSSDGSVSKPILQGLNFSLEPGDALGVIGPSSSGKTSLGRLLVGIWMPEKGAVKLDGSTLDNWDRTRLGKHIGYLPQSVELFPGTVRDNIARFDDSVSDEAVVEAAQTAGVHELITALPDGYSTDLATQGHLLSGGQVQRIALARAVLRSPVLVVLDEPNSNLDAEGDEALMQAIARLREQGSCVVVMAHRPSALAAVNKVLILRDGQQVEFGDRDEVLRKIKQTVPAPAGEPANPVQPVARRVGTLKPTRMNYGGG